MYSFVSTPDPVYVETEKDARKWAKYYLSKDRVGFDTETTGLHTLNARVKFFSFSDGDTRICAPVRLLGQFKPILESESIIKAMTNAKFDTHMVANHGVFMKGPMLDTVVMDFLDNENRRHGLKASAEIHLGLRMAPFSAVFGKVGSTDKEVETVVKMHDALESGDESQAAQLLVVVGKADGDPDTLLRLKRLYLSYTSGCIMNARQLLKVGRDSGLANKSGGTKAYVSDFFGMIGGSVAKDDREDFFPLLEDQSLISEAHEFLISSLLSSVKIDFGPIEMLKLLVGDYASLDAWASYSLSVHLEDRLSSESLSDDDDPENLNDLYTLKGVPFTRVLWNMERRGFKIDQGKIAKFAIPMKKDIDKLERTIVRLIGMDVNIGSSKQLRDVFYTKDSTDEWRDTFGEKPKYWTKGGSTGIKLPSTDSNAIKAWAERGNEVAVALVEWRQLSKLYTTYLSTLPDHADRKSRIHTNLNQVGARTGRLSSSNPNLQNIPSKGDWGNRIRQCFVAGNYGDTAGWCPDELADIPVPDLPTDTPMTLIVADYEQLEMRIMAHFSGDKTMTDTINGGYDLHSKTASIAVGADYDDVVAAKKARSPTTEQKRLVELRSHMKAVGFGLNYGMGSLNLGMQLGLPVEKVRGRNGMREVCPEAQKLIDTYFNIYPGVKKYIADTRYQCEEDLFVQTILGRYRRLEDIRSSDWGLKNKAMRDAVNSVIQGTAADICNQAMINCEYDEVLRRIGVRMLLQIHDELVFEVPDIPEYIEAASERIKELMEDPFPMRVPITISMDTAHSWGEAK